MASFLVPELPFLSAVVASFQLAFLFSEDLYSEWESSFAFDAYDEVVRELGLDTPSIFQASDIASSTGPQKGESKYLRIPSTEDLHR